MSYSSQPPLVAGLLVVGSALFCTEVLGGSLGSAANVKFLEDVSQMDADGSGTDVRLLRDLFVGKPFKDTGEHLLFSFGE